MVFSYGKINIQNFLNGIISLSFAIMIAYYLKSDDENKFESFSDYIYYIFDKFTFLYTVIIFTFIFYNIFGILINNRKTIKKEISNRSKNFLGPDFVDRSIKGGRTATNKIYDYTGRVYNYLRPNRANINPVYNIEPLYAPVPNVAYSGRDFYRPVD
jgi:hypothetical protein